MELSTTREAISSAATLETPSILRNPKVYYNFTFTFTFSSPSFVRLVNVLKHFSVFSTLVTLKSLKPLHVSA
jgi:hypothetical protein